MKQSFEDSGITKQELGNEEKNGTRKPSGAALRLLAVAKHHPEALEAA